MLKRAFRRVTLGLLPASLLVSSCGVGRRSSPIVVPSGRQGVVHGGQQPVSGAAIQLYAVGTAGDGSAAMPLLSPAATTDANGGFNITGGYTCPSPSALVYIVATGGNPGLGAGGGNANLAMMAALGPCGNLTALTFIFIDELTTVGAVYPLAGFMSSASGIGSASGDAAALAAAFTVAAELVNPSTGAAPGTGVPSGTTVPVAQIDTIGNILAACVNSAGGVAGDTTACGNLFSLTTAAGSTPATDTIGALLHLANNPGLNTAALFNMLSPGAPFQPSQAQTPPDLAVRLIQPSGLTVSPAALNFPATRLVWSQAVQTVAFTNNTAVPVGIDLAALSGAYGPISGDDPGDFVVDSSLSTCATPILPGATCSVQVAFVPTATGPRSAYLTANNTSANPAIGIPLTGEGLEASAGPAHLSNSSLNFQAAGTATNVTLTNDGTTPLTIDGIGISNDPTSGQPAFTQTNTCGATLATQSACTISITALATAQTYSTGVLSVLDDAAGGAQTLNLSYSNGFSGAVLIDFLSRSVGTQATGYVNNIPGYPAATDTFTLSGADAADFSVTNSPPSLTCFPSRQFPTCSAAVTFTPSATGVRVATLNVNGNPYGGVIGIGLPAGIQFATGFYGVPNTVPLSSVDFSTVVVGQTSPVSAVTIVNTGTLPVTISPPVLSGPNASDFSAVSSCTSVIAPNGSCALSVTASPTQPGSRSAILMLTDSTGASQQTVALKVLGINPPPVATVSSLSFSYTAPGTVSPAQSFSVTSYNGDPVRVTIGLGPLSPFVLTQVSSCAQTPCQISVAYAPPPTTGPGGLSFDNLYIVDELSGQSARVSLMGTTVQ
jgi:trimeric autotransporter adhesin